MQTNQAEVPEEIVKRAIEDLVEKKGVPQEQRQKECGRIEGLLYERMMDEFLSTLPLDKLKEINECLSNDGDVEKNFLSLIDKSEVKFESIAKKVFGDFMGEYIGLKPKWEVE